MRQDVHHSCRELSRGETRRRRRLWYSDVAELRLFYGNECSTELFMTFSCSELQLCVNRGAPPQQFTVESVFPLRRFREVLFMQHFSQTQQDSPFKTPENTTEQNKVLVFQIREWGVKFGGHMTDRWGEELQPTGQWDAFKFCHFQSKVFYIWINCTFKSVL